MSTITIGLPFQNDRETIDLAVRSVFAQTEQDWVLLAIDDGSTDGTLSRLIEVEDDRVQVIRDGRNLGLAARLNQAGGPKPN